MISDLSTCKGAQTEMDWEKEALFVSNLKRRDDEELFRDSTPVVRSEHDEFVDKYGFSYNDMWDLDRAIVMFILPRLAYYREKTTNVPGAMEVNENGQFVTQDTARKKWDEILKTICDGLHLYLDKDFALFSDNEKALWLKAKQYLFEYFESFWD